MDGTTHTGVPFERDFLAFADAAIGGDPKSLDAARKALVGALGADAAVDAAAVIAGFDGITRIADATGIPLEPPKAEQTSDLREALHLDAFISAKW